MNPEYDGFAPFYDLEYGHKTDDLDFYLHVANEIGHPVLEIGAGTGRLTTALAQAGHTVWGIDNSGKMLEKANKKQSMLPKDIQKNIHLSQQDMRDFNIDQTFPLCIIPFRAFLHNLTIDDQISTLDRIYEHLQPNGILAFDLFVPLFSMLAQSEWQESYSADEMADPDQELSVMSKVNHNPAEQLLTIVNKYKQQNIVQSQQMKYRYIFRYEMELLLNLTGFNVEQVYGGFEGQDYNFDSGLMIFTASKQED